MFGSSNNSRIGMARQRVRGDGWGDDEGGQRRKKQHQNSAQGKHKAARRGGAMNKRGFDGYDG